VYVGIFLRMLQILHVFYVFTQQINVSADEELRSLIQFQTFLVFLYLTRIIRLLQTNEQNVHRRMQELKRLQDLGMGR